MVVNDDFLNQGFTGEFCNISIGSKDEPLKNYSAFIMNYDFPGFDSPITTQRTMGTYMVAREGVQEGEVSFDVIFVGSRLNDITHLKNTPSGASGYTEYQLSNDDKRFKIKLEFFETSSGSPGTTIQATDHGFKQVFYNARNISFNADAGDDNFLKGQFTFRIPPFNEIGSANYRELDKATLINTGNWDPIETAWDADVNW